MNIYNVYASSIHIGSQEDTVVRRLYINWTFHPRHILFLEEKGSFLNYFKTLESNINKKWIENTKQSKLFPMERNGML